MNLLHKNRSWIEIDLGAVVENYNLALQQLKESCQIIAVVKANAYGLGAVPISKILEKNGCSYFCVATIDEALELRENNISSRLLVLSAVPTELARYAIENNIETLILDHGQARELSTVAMKCGKNIKVQIKLDVGLSRVGIPLNKRLESAQKTIESIFNLPNLSVTSVISHITASEVIGGDELNLSQLNLYDEMITKLELSGYSFEKHILSSTPFIKYPEYSYNYVRLGALLYGSLPDVQLSFELKPVVNLLSRIIQVKTVSAGTPVSYGPIFHCLRDTKIATIGLGFSDGIRRSVVMGGKVLIRGREAPFIGKLSSDYATIDVTDIPDVSEGDIATIFGKDGDLSQGIENYAKIYPASVSETTSLLSQRLPRFYISS